MKYREVYKAMERRWQVSPGFHFTDLSTWRSPKAVNQWHGRQLWLIIEDRVSMQRIWLTHVGNVMSVSSVKMDAQGHGCGKTHRTICSSQAQMVQEFEKLFTNRVQAA